MALSKAKDLKRKRAFVVPDEPADPIEDPIEEGEPKIESENVEIPTLDDLADLIEINDLEQVAEKLEQLKKAISTMKDNKTRPLWASLHKLWYTIGYLKNQQEELKNIAMNVDKNDGMTRRLYAWMKHVEKTEPRLGLPAFNGNGFFKKG